MAYDDNVQPFFYEICNLWQGTASGQKNFQLFFIFANNPNETYYKVPNLSFKIKTKSDTDNTTVSLYVKYEMIPELINAIKSYLENRSNTMTQLSGHRYTLFLSMYPSSDGLTYVKIKLSDGEGYTNDYIMQESTLHNIVSILQRTYVDIISISLNFIKLAQNNAIIEKMNNIERLLVGLNHKSVSNTQPIIKQQVMEPTIKPQTTEVIPPPTIENVNDEVITEIEDKVVTNPFQNQLMNKIKTDINKDPIEKLESAIKDNIILYYKEEISDITLLKNIFNENSLIFGISEGFDNLCKYISLSYSSFTRYIKKLGMITRLHKSVTTNVPMFILETRFNNLLLDKYGYLFKTIFKLYLTYRSIENKTDEQDFTYATLRYLLAPLWTTYLSIEQEIDSGDNAFAKQLKQLSYATLTNWKSVWEQRVDQLIYDNKLAINYKGGVVESMFHKFTPTIYECLTNVDAITVANVSMVNNIITQLEETFAYEEITIKDDWDFTNLSNEFLITLKTFSKRNNINKDTSMDNILRHRSLISNEFDIDNIREEFKSLKAINDFDAELKKNTKETVQ